MKRLIVVLAACSHRAPIASCEQDLSGAYTAPSGRWMVLDTGTTLEAYPLFDDAGSATELVVAPRVIDLTRAGSGASGNVKRRYMQRGDSCEARALVRLTSCKDDALELVLADVSPPLSLAPCKWPPPLPARVERWQQRE